MLLHPGTLRLISRFSNPGPPLLCKTTLLIGLSILSSHLDLAVFPEPDSLTLPSASCPVFPIPEHLCGIPRSLERQQYPKLQ